MDAREKLALMRELAEEATPRPWQPGVRFYKESNILVPEIPETKRRDSMSADHGKQTWIDAGFISSACNNHEALLAIAEAAYKLIESFGNTGVAMDGDTERHFVEIADPQLAIQLLLAVKALEEASA